MPKIDVYLASPYTHEDPGVKEWRHDRAVEAAVFLLMEGHSVYCPIGHTYVMDKFILSRGLEDQFPHDAWIEQMDKPFLLNCSNMLILMLPGWNTSKGIQLERQIAQDHGIPVLGVAPIMDETLDTILGVRIVKLNGLEVVRGETDDQAAGQRSSAGGPGEPGGSEVGPSEEDGDSGPNSETPS